MDFILLNFPEIFKYTTSFVVAWGLFACTSLIRLIIHAIVKRRATRKEDVYHLMFFTATTAMAFACLFCCPSFAANNMFTIFMVEFWYCCFAVYYSLTYLFPCTKSCFRKT